MLRAECSGCGEEYGVGDAHPGRRWTCRRCGGSVRVLRSTLASLSAGDDPRRPDGGDHRDHRDRRDRRKELEETVVLERSLRKDLEDTAVLRPEERAELERTRPRPRWRGRRSDPAGGRPRRPSLPVVLLLALVILAALVLWLLAR